MGFSAYTSITPTAVLSGTERATLVRRTYGLVLLSIAVTVLGVAFGFTQPALMNAVIAHPFITFLAMFAPLMMAMRAQRVFPQNIILTLLFAFVEGVWLAPIMLVYDRVQPGVVGQAGLLTFSTFAVLSLYATFSRRDFSAWGGFFITGLWVLIATSLLNMFFHNATAALWISGATVFVFSGLLVFDTWRIMRSGQYTQDDYVAAAVQIYLDLLNLFLAILSLLGGRDRR
jgi:FtsH-binding integral membrane protein